MPSPLRAKILAHLDKTERIPFAQFMEMALYDPEWGYYTSRESPIGMKGDYYTSGDVDPVLGNLLARQFREMSAALGEDPFTLVEVGPGKGVMCRDILDGCREEAPEFFDRLSVILVEKSPKMIERQKETLKVHCDQGARIAWKEDIQDLDRPVTGCIFSNELLDAMPVHRVRMTSSGLKEIYVRRDGDALVEEIGEPSTDALTGYLRRLEVALPENYVTEIGLSAQGWMKRAASMLHRGFFVTIDYGYVAEEFYHASRKTGTLLCYTGHKLSENPYDRIGEQDMTAHVDFTGIALAARDAGLEIAGYTNQMNFLIGLGLVQEMEKITAEPDFEPEHPRFLAMKHLMTPSGFGKHFKVLLLSKGISDCSLSGLEHRPLVPLTLPE